MATLTRPPRSWNGSNLVRYDDHTTPHRDITVPQLTLFVVWLSAIVLWTLGRASRAGLLPRPWPGPAGGGGGGGQTAVEDGSSTEPLVNGPPSSSSKDGLVAVTVQTNDPVDHQSHVDNASRQAAAVAVSSSDRRTYERLSSRIFVVACTHCVIIVV